MADILKPAFRATSGLDAAGEKVINVAKADYNVLDDGVNVEFFIDENTIQAYDETRGYKKGFAVIHDQRIWVAQRDIDAPAGTFVPGYWTATRTDPKWITVASPTRQLASGEYIAVDSAASFTTFTLPPNPTDGDTVVIKDIGGRVGYNEIKVQSSSAPGGGNQKIVRFGNQFTETLITKPFSYNMIIFANRLWHFWEAANEERGIRVEPNTAQFQSQAGDNVLRRYTSGAVIKFTLPKYANQGDMIKTVDIDGLGSKFHLIVETFDASSALGKPGQHSMEFRTSGDGFFVYNSTEKLWYVWDGDRQTRLRVIRDDVELLANESVIVFGPNNTTPQTINITLPTGVAQGDVVKIALNYLRKAQTVNIKAAVGDKIASSVQLLQFPKRSEYPPETEWVLNDVLTFNGNISYTPVIELSYIEDTTTGGKYWVVAQNVPTVERVDSKDDLTRARLGVIALASQTQANVDHENNPEKELAITPQTLANRVATESRRGIARIATTAQVNQDTTFAFQDDLIISPKKLNERTATETRRGVAEIATQVETNTGTDDTTIITPKKLQARQGSESLSGIVTYTSTVGTTPATARDTVGTNVYNKNVGNLVISPKALDQYKATQVQQGTVYLSNQSEVNAGQTASGFANSAVSPETLHARVALDTRTGLIEIATQAETDTGTDYTRAVTPKTLNDRKATEGLTGIARIATQIEFDAGTLDNVISTPLKVKTRFNDTARTSVSAASGLVESGTLWNHYTLDIREANETQRGTARLATQTEVNVGTDDKTIVTPLKLHSKKSTESSEGIIRVATNAETTAGTSKVLAVSPSGLKYVVQTETTWEATALRRGFVKLTEAALTYSGNKVTGSGVKFNSGTGLYENDDDVLNAANYPKTGYAVSSYEMNKTLQNFLPINATAVNSEKLDGLDSLQFIRRDVDQTVNGSLTLTKQLNLAAPLVSSSTANITGNTILGSLEVTGNSTFKNDVSVSSDKSIKFVGPQSGAGSWDSQATNFAPIFSEINSTVDASYHPIVKQRLGQGTFSLGTINDGSGDFKIHHISGAPGALKSLYWTFNTTGDFAVNSGSISISKNANITGTTTSNGVSTTTLNASALSSLQNVTTSGTIVSTGQVSANNGLVAQKYVRSVGVKPTLASQVPTAETVGFWSVDINDEATYSKFPGYWTMVTKRQINIDTVQTKPDGMSYKDWNSSGWLTESGTNGRDENNEPIKGPDGQPIQVVPIRYRNPDGTLGDPVSTADNPIRGTWFDYSVRDKEVNYPGTLTQFGNTLDSCYQDWVCYPTGLNGGTIRYTRTWQKNKNAWTTFSMVYTADNPPSAEDVGALPADNATMGNITILDWLRIGNVRIIPDPVTKSVKFEWIE